MSPIEYSPPTLEFIANSQLAEKRLKNRGGNVECKTDGCGFKFEGPILEVVELARAHDSDHKLIVVEDSCGFGVL